MKCTRTSLFSIIFIASISTAQANDDSQIFKLSLSELMELKVDFASGLKESLKKTPGTIEIITAEQIRQCGYTELIEVMADLANMNILILNGSGYAFSNPRGHLALGGVRIMINGVEDNNLWDQNPYMSRQYPLSNVKRIEVLSGPSSVIYGANAYLATINIITNDSAELKNDGHRFIAKASTGSYQTNHLDSTVYGRSGDFSYDVSARYFESDEPDYSNDWGFLSNELFANSTYWGPLLDSANTGRNLGHYADPSEDWGVIARFNYKNMTFGVINWKTAEAYGPQFAADKVQNNLIWNNQSEQYFVEYSWETSSDVNLFTRILYRENRLWGEWAESFPFTSDTSFVSLTEWNSDNASVSFTQNFEFKLDEHLSFNGQLEYERKRLTRAYDIPGYYGISYSSSVPNSDLGPHGFGAAIGLSTDTDYQRVPSPRRHMPEENLQRIYERGGYFQAVYDMEQFRYHLGVRYDDNSIHGSEVTPRASVIYYLDDSNSFKLSYGEGYLTPSALLLYGGFSGRNANPDLQPEESSNVEASWHYQGSNQLHSLTFFRSKFDHLRALDVNSELRVNGIEYRSKYESTNFLNDSWPIQDFYLNVSYTDSETSHIFDSTSGSWIERQVALGGVAPFKFNFGLNLPISNSYHVNLRGRYVGEMEHHIGNILRERGTKHDYYYIVDLVGGYQGENFSATLKLTNLLDYNYTHSNIFLNSSGDDFANRSLGFPNSLLPQEGRATELMLEWQF